MYFESRSRTQNHMGVEMNTNPIKSALNIQLKEKLIFGILQVRSSLIYFEQIRYTDRIFFKNNHDLDLSYNSNFYCNKKL